MGFVRALLSGILSIERYRQSKVPRRDRKQRRKQETYTSLTPAPTPAPLVFTDTVASVNPHAEAAAVGMAAEASKDSWRTECHSCMMSERPKPQRPGSNLEEKGGSDKAKHRGYSERKWEAGSSTRTGRSGRCAKISARGFGASGSPVTARPPAQALISRHLDGVRAAKHFFFAPSSGLSGLPATVAIPEILERLNSRSFAIAPCLSCLVSSPGSPPAPAVCLDVPTPRLRFTDGSPWSAITTSWIWAVVVTITTSINWILVRGEEIWPASMLRWWFVPGVLGSQEVPLLLASVSRIVHRPSFHSLTLSTPHRPDKPQTSVALPFRSNRHCSSPAILSVASEALVGCIIRNRPERAVILGVVGRSEATEERGTSKLDQHLGYPRPESLFGTSEIHLDQAIHCDGC